MRRWLIVVAAAVLLVTGGITIAGQVLTWTHTDVPPAAPPVVTDVQFSGAAAVAAADYLSWDQTDKSSRQTALRRVAAPHATVDGWDGTGRQAADSPAAIGLVRGSGDRAVVTVRVRVTPFTVASGTPPAAAPTATQDAGANVAAAPNVNAPGWTAEPARWLNLAVPLALRDGRLVLAAPPAPVGSPPTTAEKRAVAATSSSGDAAFAQSTRDTVTTLLRSYGTGDLAYGRASGTTYAGLDKAAALDNLSDWRVSALQDGHDGMTRVGDATVTWALSGSAGKLTASYRVELRKQNDRWYLATISAETEEVT